jgi:two-component system chemotaxis sensor kinase CheA
MVSRSEAIDKANIPTPMPPRGAAVESAHHGMPLVRRDEVSLRSVSQTVRVDIRKLDRLMTVVGEMALLRSMMARLADRVRRQSEFREIAGELYRLDRTFERHLAQMQAGILEVRMVPLGQAFDKLARVVRQISKEHEKQVNLVVTGAETEIDKLIVEELSDPLMHMIRNAIDHGIEPRDERIRLGKPPIGTIALNAFQKGNQVVIEVEDDGAGIDPRGLVEAAVRRGLLTMAESSELTHKETLALVFMAGFTTKLKPTDLSGRGVGLDVVKTNIAKLGGIIDVTSEVVIGTKMTITLPITLAIISVLTVEVEGRAFAIPLASVDEAIVLDESVLRNLDGREVLTLRGTTLPTCRLALLFELKSRSEQNNQSGKKYVVIVSVGERRLGLIVDRLFGQQDIVIKALGKSLSRVRGFAGATELGDQRVALVLDVAAIVEEVMVTDPVRIATLGGGAA